MTDQQPGDKPAAGLPDPTRVDRPDPTQPDPTRPDPTRPDPTRVEGGAEPTRAEAGPAEGVDATAPVSPRFSGSAAVPPPTPKKSRWRRAGKEEPTLTQPDDWKTTTPVDPWAGHDLPEHYPLTAETSLPPTHIDQPPMPPTRIDAPPAAAQNPAPPAAPYTAPPAATPYTAPPGPPPPATPYTAPPAAAPYTPPPGPPPAGAPFTAQPPGPPPPPPSTRKSKIKKDKRKNAAAPVNRLPVQTRPAPGPYPPGGPPPPWARRPSGPPPRPRKRRHWFRRLMIFSLLGVLCCCGLPFAYFTFPAARQYPVTAALPQTFADLSRSDDSASQRAAERLAEQLQGANADDVFAGVYTDGRGKRVTLFGVTGLRFNPRGDVQAQLDQVTDKYRLTDVQSFETGEFGAHERCGVGRTNGNAVVVCAWADHGSLATVLLTRRSLEESADLVNRLRDEVLTTG